MQAPLGLGLFPSALGIGPAFPQPRTGSPSAPASAASQRQSRARRPRPSASDLPDNAHGLVPAASNFHCLLLAACQLLSSLQPTHRQLRGLSPKLFIPASTGQRAAKAMHVTIRRAWVFLTALGRTPFPSPADCRAPPRPCRPPEIPSASSLNARAPLGHAASVSVRAPELPRLPPTSGQPNGP